MEPMIWARVASYLDGGSVGRLAAVGGDAITIGTVWAAKEAQDEGKAACQHHYKTGSEFRPEHYLQSVFVFYFSHPVLGAGARR